MGGDFPGGGRPRRAGWSGEDPGSGSWTAGPPWTVTHRQSSDDWVKAGAGFGMHPHRDMEIVTCVLSGALEHKDSLSHGEVLRPGEFQRMTAGTGIRHCEFNPSLTHEVHLYQIWLLPRERGLEPGYEQKRFDPSARANQWQLVASPDGASGSLTIQQDAKIYLADLSQGQAVPFEIAHGRHAWLQVLRGAVELNARALSAGDGAAISDEAFLDVKAPSTAELMLFDLS